MELSDDIISGLKSAFAAESMTAQRYASFAQTAEIEGHLEIAALFTELAESIACAAHGHYDYLRDAADPSTGRPVGPTRLNLAAAVTGELYEATDLYPRLASAAHDEGLADVASWLEALSALKKIHVAKLNDSLAALVDRAPSGPEPIEDGVNDANG